MRLFAGLFGISLLTAEMFGAEIGQSLSLSVKHMNFIEQNIIYCCE